MLKNIQNAVKLTVTATNVNTDTPIALSAPASKWIVENGSAVNAYIALDTPATTGSILLIPGAIWEEQETGVSTFHVLTASSVPVNAANGIIIQGWS